MSPTTVVSAPGKVLIAGGYLVLDPTYSGVVVSTTSRFYATVRDGEPSLGPNILRVRSPQFLDATWEYLAILDAPAAVSPLPQNSSTNKFVQQTLQNVLLLALEILSRETLEEALSLGLDIVILGDNDFYSQRAKLQELNLPRTFESLAHIPPFSPTGVHLADVHKTGLGSSAALITSLVAALLVHLHVVPAVVLADDVNASSIPGFHLVHNLAQYVHCLAQGKIGSGFDVSAAVFGSHLYTRFDPAVLKSAMVAQPDSKDLLATVISTNPRWNYRVEKFVLPPLTRIMLADVDAGSDTPSLVSKVLEWRKEESLTANTLWRDLDQLNQSLAQTMLHLSQLYEEDHENYASAVKYITSLQPVQWAANPSQPDLEKPILAAFYEAHRISQIIRTKMCDMGTAAGVPIEPPEQTKLLDTCMAQAGVVGGGVPGAGGYDAIWLLVLDPASCCATELSPVQRVEHVWQHYTDLSVSPLSSNENVGRGLRIEELEAVIGLTDAVATMLPVGLQVDDR